MRAKAIAARRQRLAELARMDRSNRCEECKRSLVGQMVITYAGQPEKYCASCAAAGAGKDD